MPTHRFYLPDAKPGDRLLTLCDREAHHALRVLRLQPGDAATVVNGAGVEFRTVVSTADRRRVMLEVLDQRSEPPPDLQVVLVQSILKHRAMELIVEKATELGVSRIVPLTTVRSVVDPNPERSESKRSKWQVTAVEAIKQCGALYLPRIEPPCSISQAFAHLPASALSLVGSLRPAAPALAKSMASFERSPVTAVAIWIGPEGDFTDTELADLGRRGAQEVNFGKRVLRSETAALHAISVISYEVERLTLGQRPAPELGSALGRSVQSAPGESGSRIGGDRTESNEDR